LVLLVIFMVTAPLVAPGMIDLPSVGQTTAEVPLKPLEVQVAADGVLSVRDLQQGESELTPMPSTQLADFIRDRQQENPGQPVVIAADGKVPYESVVQVMDELQQQGVARVGLLVKQTGTGR